MIDPFLQALLDPAVLPPVGVAAILVCIKLASVLAARKGDNG